MTDADAGALHADVADRAVPWLVPRRLRDPARRRADRGTVGAPGLRLPVGERGVCARGEPTPASSWIGPPPGAIELMGDKGAAKEPAAGAGVPVVPDRGDDGVVSAGPSLSRRLAGGGGKGMRVVARRR